jgi:hypothetical protein
MSQFEAEMGGCESREQMPAGKILGFLNQIGI